MYTYVHIHHTLCDTESEKWDVLLKMPYVCLAVVI